MSIDTNRSTGWARMMGRAAGLAFAGLLFAGCDIDKVLDVDD